MKTITEIFEKSDSPLAKLLSKTKTSQNLEPVFHMMLDENLAKHCKIASYDGSKLAVMVTNTSWATRLRYAIPDIIKNLKIQPEFKTITSIRYNVEQRPTSSIKKILVNKPLMSKENEISWKKAIADLKKKAEQLNVRHRTK